jgi:hypothetical protein
MKTSTRKKCEALAKEHNITIEVERFVGYCYWLTIPEGKIMEDGTTGRNDSELFMPLAEVWALVMEDLKSMINHDWLDNEDI